MDNTVTTTIEQLNKALGLARRNIQSSTDDWSVVSERIEIALEHLQRETRTTKYSLRERIGMWLSHRLPWEDYLSLMTCGKPDHIWRSSNGYRAEDCPMCKLEKEIECLKKQ